MKQHLLATVLFTVGFLSFAIILKGQSLQPGMVMPRVENSLVNFKQERIERYDHISGKAIIYEFWGTGCLSCIQSFPKLDTLQKRFNNSLQIILVCREGSDSLTRFFKRRNRIKVPAVLFLTGQDSLFKQFNIEALPFVVWTDDNNNIKAITEGYDLNEPAVAAFLRQPDFKFGTLPPKDKVSRSAIDQSVSGELLYYSYLAKWSDTLSVPTRRGLVYQGKSFLSRSGISVAELYQEAFNKRYRHLIGNHNYYISNSLPDYHVRETNEVLTGEWKRNYSYTYELMCDSLMSNHIFSYMEQDLKRVFNLRLSVVQIPIECLVLKRSDSPDQLRTKGGKAYSNLTGKCDSEDCQRSMRNLPFSKFFSFLQPKVQYRTGRMFKDETGYKGNIDISLSNAAFYPLDFEKLKTELFLYGLQIDKEVRIEKVFVLHPENIKMPVSIKDLKPALPH